MTCGLFGTRNFWQRNVSAQGYFHIWTFLHRCRNVCAKMSILLCKVPKYPNAEIFCCQNVHGAKTSLCRKFPAPKSPNVETFLCCNVHLPEHVQGQRVHEPKFSCDETFMPKWVNEMFCSPLILCMHLWLVYQSRVHTGPIFLSLYYTTYIYALLWHTLRMLKG